MNNRNARVVIGMECIAVMSTGEIIELVSAIQEKQSRIALKLWPTTKPHEVEPWQNKRRKPWRKRK